MFNTLRDYVIETMAAMSENGYGAFVEDGREVVTPANGEEVDITDLMTVHQMLNGDYSENTYAINRDGSTERLK